MEIIFLRHGKTAGNCEKRYIGKTDEPLCDLGIAEINAKQYPKAGIIICSPMKRCVETAKLIYPNAEAVLCDGMQECNFGAFEGKNYLELNGNPAYQKWLDSGGTCPFPNGERLADFKKRCVIAFEKVMDTYKEQKSIAFVVHGGTIMAIFEKYAFPQKEYYDFQVKNGCGYAAKYDGKQLSIVEEI